MEKAKKKHEKRKTEKPKELPQRKFRAIEITTRGVMINVCSYNVLARGLDTASSFPYADEVTLDFDRRK